MIQLHINLEEIVSGIVSCIVTALVTCRYYVVCV